MISFREMLYVKFTVKNQLFSPIYTKTVSLIISVIFDKICTFRDPTLRVVFTPSTSTIANKKKIRVKHVSRKLHLPQVSSKSVIDTWQIRSLVSNLQIVERRV